MANHARWASGFLLGSGCTGVCFWYFKPDYKEIKTEPSSTPLKWDSNWDKREAHCLVRPKKRTKEREEKKIAAVTPTATRNILMVRHGHYEKKASAEKNMQLTALGQKQASELGQRLKDLKLNYSKIIESKMIRAIQTSDIIQKYLPKVPIESTELLDEGRPIPCEPKSGSYLYEYEYFTDGPRIEAAFRKYFHRAQPTQEKDSFEIMVCHANVIRYFVCRLLQVPPECWLRFSLHHCSITWAVIHPDGNVTIRSFGDAGFLPCKQVTRH